MSFLAEWITVFCIGLVVIITPGPNFALTLRNSLSYSRQAGLYTALGVAVGHLVHTTYCMVGIGALIARSILLFNLLKWVGAAYLVYVGIRSLQAKPAAHEPISRVSPRQISGWMAFRIGLLGDLLNPKATLFFLALFTQIIHPGTSPLVQALYGATIILLALVWYGGVALFISQPLVKNALQSAMHWVERVTGAVLIALGLRLAIAKLND